MTRIYAFANQKGGVGKTTSVVNVGAALAEAGQRVLLVDIDPQSNATTSLGIDPRRISRSIYEVLVTQRPPAEVQLPTKWPRLSLLPSVAALAGATVELNRLPDPHERARRLQRGLSALTEYDYILIDAPPSLGILTVNALTAAQGVIVPVQCEYLALEGLSQLTHTISLVQRGLNPGLSVRGVVLTMFDARTILARQVVEEVRRHFPKRTFRTLIPRSVRLSEAPSFGEPGIFYAPHSRGAKAYRALAQELLQGDQP